MTRLSRSGRHIVAPASTGGVTLDEALRAQTIGAAWQLFSEHEVGSLEVGKFADLVVLSADPATVSAAELPSLRVLETYLAGERVYEA